MAQFPLVVVPHHRLRSCDEYLRVPGRAGGENPPAIPSQLGRVLST